MATPEQKSSVKNSAARRGGITSLNVRSERIILIKIMLLMLLQA
jgi:hypothetical protein